MKPITQQILVGIAGCIALTLVFSVGLSVAVNYGVAQFEQQVEDFLPTAQPEPDAQNL